MKTQVNISIDELQAAAAKFNASALKGQTVELTEKFEESFEGSKNKNVLWSGKITWADGTVTDFSQKYAREIKAFVPAAAATADPAEFWTKAARTPNCLTGVAGRSADDRQAKAAEIVAADKLPAEIVADLIKAVKEREPFRRVLVSHVAAKLEAADDEAACKAAWRKKPTRVEVAADNARFATFVAMAKAMIAANLTEDAIVSTLTAAGCTDVDFVVLTAHVAK